MRTNTGSNVITTTREALRAEFKGEKMVKITLIRSLISEVPTNKKTLLTMGLRRPNKSVVLPNVDSIWGMIFKVGALVRVDKVSE